MFNLVGLFLRKREVPDVTCLFKYRSHKRAINNKNVQDKVSGLFENS